MFFISVFDQAADLAINPSFLDEVATELERHEDDDDDDDDDQERTAYVARIYPSDCPNLMTGMTSLITSFVETGVNKRRGAYLYVSPFFQRLTL